MNDDRLDRFPASPMAHSRETRRVLMPREHQRVSVTCEVPVVVRKSRSDPAVLLFYRTERHGRWICVVVKRVDNDEAFVITAYPTDAIKEGETIWTR
jgi:hypothetical protein